MGLTERHWFENEEPELTEQQLEDIVYENKKAYDNGYVKGFHDALKEHPQIVRCKDCKDACISSDDWVICTHIDSNGNDKHPADWFCADGVVKDNCSEFPNSSVGS